MEYNMENLVSACHHAYGTNDKIDIVRQFKSNELWTKALYYAYHPDYTYGVKNILYGCAVGQPTKEMFDLLDKLRTRELTGNAARDAVGDFCEEHGSLIVRICKKDLDCGISEKSINKALGHNFIPMFNVQLAEEVPVEKVRVPCVGQIKYDGVRVIASIDEEGNVKLKTRNGKVFNYVELENILKDSGVTNYIFDGELIIASGKSEDRSRISGIVNSAIKGTPITYKSTIEGIIFLVFDGMPYNQFCTELCSYTYKERFEHTEHLVGIVDTDSSYPSIMSMAETYKFANHEEINKRFKGLLEEGYEGLILKRWEDTYKFRRSKDWIKVKAIKDTTLVCEDVIAGEPGTKYESGIGALYCSGFVEGKKVYVKVGSGLTDNDRFADVHKYLDKKIDVKYNGIIQDKTTGQWSLFLPRFKCIRGDI